MPPSQQICQHKLKKDTISWFKHLKCSLCSLVNKRWVYEICTFLHSIYLFTFFPFHEVPTFFGIAVVFCVSVIFRFWACHLLKKKSVQGNNVLLFLHLTTHVLLILLLCLRLSRAAMHAKENVKCTVWMHERCITHGPRFFTSGF